VKVPFIDEAEVPQAKIVLYLLNSMAQYGLLSPANVWLAWPRLTRCDNESEHDRRIG
jgi:hypothetical protein